VNVAPNVLLLLAGLFLLVFAADWLIHACVKLSYILRLTPLFIGIIFIAFGTSAPEAGVGVIAALRNQSIISFGNVLGSNIANIALVIGLCAMLTPIDIVNKNIFRKEMLMMILAVVLLFILSIDLVISRADGVIFILSFIAFCVISYKGAREFYDADEVKDFKLKKQLHNMHSPPVVILIVCASIAGIIVGADLMVRGGVNLAKIFNISPWLIGITVFAIGTSLPELATSLTASAKKVHSISVGNIIGSNIFNILFVLGIVALIQPIVLQASILKFELPILLIFNIALLIVMKTAYKVTRLEGLALFLGYIAFIVLLIMRS